MKKLLFILLLTSVVLPQQKYFILFKDKGPAISKMSANQKYEIVKDYISERALLRREAATDREAVIDFLDLPVNPDYIYSLSKLGVNIIHKLNWFNAVSAYLENSQLKKIKQLDFVESVQKVRSFTKTTQPDSELNIFKSAPLSANYNIDYGNSLGQLEFLDIPVLHDRGVDGEGVIIGVLDTGFDWQLHPAMRNMNVIAERDFVFNDDITRDEPDQDYPGQDNHGTHVSSVIGAYREGEMIGAAYNSSFLLAKTEKIDTETRTEEDNFAAALEWLENKGADITTSSLGYNTFDSQSESYEYSDMDGKTTIVTRASEIAFNKGLITVTSAGNEGAVSWRYITAPGDGFNVITVGALSPDNNIIGFSSRGPTHDERIKPEICAQGSSVYGANTAQQYNYASGTSSAAPAVAGAIALLKQVHPHLNNRQVRNIVMESGDNADDPNNDIGWGKLSAKYMVEFPNVKFEDDNVILYKYFAEDLLAGSTPLILANVNWQENGPATMVYESEGLYSYSLPLLSENDTVRISFTWIDSEGKSRFAPDTDVYVYIAETENVHLKTVESNTNFSAEDYVLDQNYPNPFNIGTTIRFYTASNTFTEIDIYDLLGQKVRTLYRSASNKGYNFVFWNGRNNYGAYVSSGIYFYSMKTNEHTAVQKMVLVK